MRKIFEQRLFGIFFLLILSVKTVITFLPVIEKDFQLDATQEMTVPVEEENNQKGKETENSKETFSKELFLNAFYHTFSKPSSFLTTPYSFYNDKCFYTYYPAVLTPPPDKSFS